MDVIFSFGIFKCIFRVYSSEHDLFAGGDIDMKTIRNLLVNEAEKLSDLIQDKTAPDNSKMDGHLRVTNKNGCPSYYHCFRPPDSNITKRKYIRKRDQAIAASLAQQDYDHTLLELAKRQLTCIQRFLNTYDETAFQDLYHNLHPARKALIQPYMTDWDTFVTGWYADAENAIPDALPIRKPDSGFETNRGEMVRSKSEKIIADQYEKLRIPYQYEKPLMLLDGNRQVIVHPDFTLLKSGEFTEYYHEHFGMMDIPDYCKKALQKIALYRKNGIYEGERLLLTFESSLSPLNIKEFEALVRHALM